MSRILLLGGTGFVGRAVCGKLVEAAGGAGQTLIVPTRHPARAKHLQPLPSLQLVRADVHDEAQLHRLVQGADAVVNLVAILHGSDAAFRHVHVELPRKLAAACLAANVRRVVHVSALGVGTAATAGAAGAEPSRYLRSKAAGEAVLRAAGLDLTILRPSVIFGEHDRFLNLFATLQAVFPVVPLGGADARFQPVWVQDVASAIVRCLADAGTIGQTFECAGPSVYTLRQIVEGAGRWSGHPRPVFGLPDALARAQAQLMEWLPGGPLMSRDNIDSMRVPNVASGSLPGLAALGIVPTSLEDVAPGYLAADQGIARLNRWRAERR
jgi:NADH dehydrogenase